MADREAFDAYVRERWVPLLRTATLLTGDRHAAEDLVQETLVRAAQHWSRVEPATADAYVRRILYTRSVDAWRWRRRQPDPVDAAAAPRAARPQRRVAGCRRHPPHARRGAAPAHPAAAGRARRPVLRGPHRGATPRGCSAAR